MGWLIGRSVMAYGLMRDWVWLGEEGSVCMYVYTWYVRANRREAICVLRKDRWIDEESQFVSNR